MTSDTETTTGASYHQVRQRVEAPPGCPVNHDWNPLDEGYMADPYPVARELRENTPVFFAESIGYAVVTRIEDIEAVFMDPDTYASVNVQDPVFPLHPDAAEILAAPDFNPIAVMSNRPEPDHGRIRRYTRRGFSSHRLRKLEPYIRERAHELLDGMLAGEPPADFIQSFAFPLPGETLFRLIGFPPSDDERIKRWSQDRKAFSWGQPSPEEQRRIAEQMVTYWRYCRDFVAQKHADPGDDITSELLAAHDADPEDLTYREVESIVYGLSFAGHEPVTALLGNALLALLPRRDQWDELCADPSLIPRAVEEVVRFNSSQISWRRITTRPTTLNGVDLAEGTPILLNFAAANRDPERFEDPDAFDIHRENAARHISFGKGIHLCLGMPLAKLETVVTLETLVERVPSLRLEPDQEIPRFPNITFRGPERLLVAWDRGDAVT